MTVLPFAPNHNAGVTARLMTLKSSDQRTGMIVDDVTLGSVFNFIGVSDSKSLLLVDILGSLDGERGRTQ